MILIILSVVVIVLVIVLLRMKNSNSIAPVIEHDESEVFQADTETGSEPEPEEFPQISMEEQIRIRDIRFNELINSTWTTNDFSWTFTHPKDRPEYLDDGTYSITLLYDFDDALPAKGYRITVKWDENVSKFVLEKVEKDFNETRNGGYIFLFDLELADITIPDFDSVKEVYFANKEYRNYLVDRGRFGKIDEFIKKYDRRYLKELLEYAKKSLVILPIDDERYYEQFIVFSDWYRRLINDYENDVEAIEKGEKGEGFILSELAKYNTGKWSIIRGAILPITSPKTELERKIAEFENDIIIINEHGIFTLEIKNYQKGSMEIFFDGRVAHYNSKGELLPSEKQTIVEQSENHVRYLEMFLKDNLGEEWFADKKEIVHGIIVIANNEFAINKNELNYPIVRPVLLGKSLTKDYGTELDEQQQEDIANCIRNNLKEEHKYPHKDYREIFSTFTDKRVEGIYDICRGFKEIEKRKAKNEG